MPTAVSRVPCETIEAIYAHPQVLSPSDLANNDDLYLTTFPGESYDLVFERTDVSPGLERTYFLRAGGYYIEWIRRDWLGAESRTTSVFQPDPSSILTTAARWLEQKDALESSFFTTRISGERRQK